MNRYIRTILGEFLIWFCNYVIAYVPSHIVRILFYKEVMQFSIGNNSSILLGCKFSCRNNFSLGSSSTINQNCHLDNRGGIIICDNVSISPEVSIVTADHDINSPSFDGRSETVKIENYAFVGYRALILKGVIISKGSVIAAATCQTKDTVEFGVYAGVPGKLISMREKNLVYNPVYRRLFH